MHPEPFRIEPTFVPRIWGARSLAPLYPEKSNLPEPIGEVWLTGIDCKIASGPFAGKTLGAAWREMPPEWRGTRFTEPSDFLILVKFIFPNDKLSVQVHPDDAYAAVHEQAAGGRGKTEMWHILSAQPGAKVLVGLKHRTTKGKFLKALSGSGLEDLFVSYAVHEGDTFFVPAGTPHTIGPGMILCEVQEYSDLTYRVYDYGRLDAKGKPRELHIEKALAVTNFAGARGGKVLPVQLSRGASQNSLLAACPYFAAERWESTAAIPVLRDLDRAQFYVFLHGAGTVHWNADEAAYQAGECWLMPACLDSFELIPKRHTSLIRAHVPELRRLRKSLRELGISESAMSQVTFE